MPKWLAEGTSPQNLPAALGGGGGSGATTGPISLATQLPDAISGTTQPTQITLGNDTTAQSHPDGSTTGLKMEAKVPEDYDSGDLVLSIVCKPSTAVSNPNNVMRLQVAAEIANTNTGALDVGSYPAQNFDILLPDNTIDITRIPILIIAEGDFGPGDCIVFLVKRLGADGADLHTGALEIIGYDYGYTGQIASRESTQTVAIFDDTDETQSAPRKIDGTVGNFGVLVFTAGDDDEQKFEFAVPDNWDERNPMQVRLSAVMTVAEAFNIVELELEAEIASIDTGGLITHGPTTFLLQPANNTLIFRSPTVFEIPASVLSKGSFVTVKLARRGSTGANDNHTGNLEVFGALVSTFNVPLAGFTTALIQSLYLERSSFNVVTPNVTGVQEYPDLAGDFETWQLMASTQPAGQIHVAFQGRLNITNGQTQITRVTLPIKGSAGSDYRLRIYAEGTVPPVFDSGLTAAPTVRTVLTVNSGDLSAQPTGEGRFHVVLEATLDNLEELRVGRPFATME